MKLFDLRFGETIIIYPQIDKSFFYEQIKDSPNNYESFEDYQKSIIANPSLERSKTYPEFKKKCVFSDPFIV